MAFEGEMFKIPTSSPEAAPEVETVKGYQLAQGQMLQQYSQGELVWTRIAKVSGHTVTLEDGSSFEPEEDEEFTIQK